MNIQNLKKDIIQKIAESDDNYVILNHGEEVFLEFNTLELKQGYQRKIEFAAEGYYEKIQFSNVRLH